jgi:tyrosinase
MSRLSRRKFVATGAAGIGASALPMFTRLANAAPFIRYNVASANGQAMLKKYAAAVKIMKGMPTGNPLSWDFQWYSHWVPGTSFSQTFKTNKINSTNFPTPANKALAQTMWDGCQAHGAGMIEDNFLPWHRAYVCAFEEIIRTVLHDPTFTLPYWNYSVAAGYPIPKEFRLQNDPVFGPLFEPKRRSVVNAGQPIFTGMGTAADLSPASALAKPKYSSSGPVSGFCLELDQNLHGNVHVFVGTQQNMGFVPNAAGDPIFWMHHCNIDRLWVSWNAVASHTNPTTAAWLNQSYTFAGPNGQAITAVNKDYTNTRKCNYVYDQLTQAPLLVAGSAAPATAAAAAAAEAPIAVAAQADAATVPLGTRATRVSLRPAAGSPPPSGSPLGARVAALPESRRLYLVIKNLYAENPVQAIYRVYLDLPEGAAVSDPLNSHYVGSINFFDSAGHEQHGMHAAKPYSFDITEVAANLAAMNLLKADHTVTLVPSGEPSDDAKAVVGDISIIEQ